MRPFKEASHARNLSLLEPAHDEVTERRHAFYAGAIAIMGMLMDFGGTPEEIEYVKSIKRELMEHTLSLGRPQ